MFRFTIRDVLLVMVIVGLSVGWWLDRTALTAGKENAQEFARITLWMSNYGDVEPGSQEWRALEETNRRRWQEMLRRREEYRTKRQRLKACPIHNP